MSMMLVGILGFLNLMIEATWLHRVAIFEITPNLSLILVVFWGILQGSQRGRRLGLWIGLLQDFLFCRVLGYYGLVYYLLGHVSGFFNKDFYQGHYILPITVVAGADFIYGLIQYFIFGFLTGDLAFGVHMVRRILPEVCYTTMVSLPLYPLNRLASYGIRQLDRWIQSRKGKRL